MEKIYSKIYELDKKSSYKRLRSGISKKVELWKIRNIPGDYEWTDCTLSGITITSNVASLTSGYIYGYIVTPQLTNVSYGSEDYYKDVNKIQIINKHTVNEGTIKYFACNDGKSYKPIKALGTSDVIYNAIYTLPGNGNSTQVKYNTLLIKVELRRNAIGDESPTLQNIRVISN